jgi:hypothetical protein
MLAEGLSPNTVYGYDRDLKLWLAHQGDQDIGKITSANLLEFLNYLRSEYAPRRIARLDVKSWQPSGSNRHSSRNVRQALGSFKQPFRNKRSFTGRCDLTIQNNDRCECRQTKENIGVTLGLDASRRIPALDQMGGKNTRQLCIMDIREKMSLSRWEGFLRQLHPSQRIILVLSVPGQVFFSAWDPGEVEFG